MKDLLACIAFHYDESQPSRKDCFIKVLDNMVQYPCSLDIIVDTNLNLDHPIIVDISNRYNVEFYSHKNLWLNLVMCHRKHMKSRIGEYHNFMYMEDDMVIPYQVYLRYLENFRILFPNNVPAAVRLETDGKDLFALDCSHSQVAEGAIKTIGGRTYFSSANPTMLFG